MKRITYQVFQEAQGEQQASFAQECFLQNVVLGPMSDAVFPSNYEAAVREAWNGAVTVEDVPDAEPDAEATLLETILDHEIRLSSLEWGL